MYKKASSYHVLPCSRNRDSCANIFVLNVITAKVEMVPDGDREIRCCFGHQFYYSKFVLVRLVGWGFMPYLSCFNLIKFRCVKPIVNEWIQGHTNFTLNFTCWNGRPWVVDTLNTPFFIIFFYYSQLTILASYEIEYVGGIVDSSRAAKACKFSKKTSLV